jgi:hypothetical protein
MDPTTPALHWAITSLGVLRMNIGDPMMGKGRCASAPGSLDMECLLE